ncbi:TolC family protein [Fibrella sp. WM1]|uniref:TolC family protein n=1 Tax=Fibrella musci TaxID=3242485 RepID=UPI00351FC767
MVKTRKLFIPLCLLAVSGLAQPAPPGNRITLSDCYTAAQANYPLLRQQGIIQQTGELAINSLQQNRRLPQVLVNGQATWQSDVTRLPIELPNLAFPSLSKDQYRLTLDASYTLYDGNLLPLQTALQQAQTATAQQQLVVELNRLKEQVNGLFLNTLLTSETIGLTQVQLTDLRSRMAKLQANVNYGNAAPMNLDALRAEMIRVEQRLADLHATRHGLLGSLQLLTELPISDSTQLAVEELPLVPPQAPNRPELALFNRQRALADAQLGLLAQRTKPRLSLFAQTGLGRPGLNLLSNEFKGLFIGGLRLNWNLAGMYTLKNDRQILDLNRQVIDSQQATFEKNLSVQLRQQQTEIDRLEAQLGRDAELIGLRSKVRQAAAAQLDNGVIATRDYTTELTNETQAKLNQKIHELQLLQARIQYRTLSGN